MITTKLAGTARDEVLVIACGALAREITALIRLNHWEHLKVQCLPAELHNRPERIPERVRAKIREGRRSFRSIFVAYADCGTGGLLDAVLAEEGVERIPGAHCYQFFAGAKAFDSLAEAEPGTFYLTDFLARHFERLIWKELGLADHPELIGMYFANYTRVLYLSQVEDEDLQRLARAAAARLGLAYEYRFTGYGELEDALARTSARVVFG